MTFKEWMDRPDAPTQMELAAMMGAGQGRISALYRGKGRFTPEQADAIERISGGAVTMREALGIAESGAGATVAPAGVHATAAPGAVDTP